VLGELDWPHRVIRIDARLNQAAARSTLAHELVHAERGPLPAIPALADLEENLVDQETARRLIPLPQLAHALADSNNPTQAAAILDVDKATLVTRLTHLHPAEKAWLRNQHP